ncbi:MAG TPA: ribosome recycling factor [Niabella sp.]|nr:ribosome recycling factor [Niabella sp.]HOZ98307.1 ribosome recycling factor [Niabella sp.]HQW13386.1 ribosome recycling factor [Niabella sp.]HQX18780.1 ribosome recycling factor [Niabella sp.]HQX42654.1 ribosome recycling factor [Niabella sp.]
MQDQIDLIIYQAEEGMNKAIGHLETELIKIRAGKATPQIVDGIVVDYYGSTVPISQVGNITVMDARTINIQPWEKNMLQPIERAIIAANIGINPQNDGVNIRLFLPPLTEERRKELVKKSLVEGENSKVGIRSARRDGIEAIKKAQKDGLSEDASKDAEASVQQLTDKFIALVEKHLVAKEKEIMSI